MSHLTLKAHLEVANTLEKEDLDMVVEHVMAARIMRLRARGTAKQRRQFERFSGSKRKEQEALNSNKVVVNLSSKTFDAPTISVLAKGF